jgi:peptidoglycan/xylan/chitin deacetylase (PgdA/CDA1 family)
MLQGLSTLSDWISGPERLVRRIGAASDALLGSRGCLFTFHRVADTTTWATLPNRNFYLDLAFLDRLLAYLARTGWAVVTLDEVLRRAARGHGSGRYVNFSVDDCYRDTYEEVVPLFRRHGVPVTLFVTTGIPDGTLTLWHAGLEDVLRRRDHILLDGRRLELETADAKQEAFARIAADWDGPDAVSRYIAFCRQNGVDAGEIHWRHAMSWDMLEALRNEPLVEIGAHTISHARVSSLPPPMALAELQGCRERLMQKLGVAARHFAFPYGRSNDCSRRDLDLARQAGFASAATTRKGLVRRGQDAFGLPRNTLNGAHRNLAMTELHLTGCTGVVARMLGRV